MAASSSAGRAWRAPRPTSSTSSTKRGRGRPSTSGLRPASPRRSRHGPVALPRACLQRRRLWRVLPSRHRIRGPAADGGARHQRARVQQHRPIRGDLDGRWRCHPLRPGAASRQHRMVAGVRRGRGRLARIRPGRWCIRISGARVQQRRLRSVLAGREYAGHTAAHGRARADVERARQFGALRTGVGRRRRCHVLRDRGTGCVGRLGGHHDGPGRRDAGAAAAGHVSVSGACVQRGGMRVAVREPDGERGAACPECQPDALPRGDTLRSGASRQGGR